MASSLRRTLDLQNIFAPRKKGTSPLLLPSCPFYTLKEVQIGTFYFLTDFSLPYNVNNNFIVAIGSSAGGLKPMISFFDCTLHDHATYIILRHIPFNHLSKLQSILQRHSKLKIIEAANDTLIEQDTVYMPPANMYMTIENDRLYLQKRIQSAMFPNSSVNIFFTSLAKEAGNKSIAIILSGMSSDGTKGASLIKASGGLIIAQEPYSCEYESMPMHVIKAGLADHILLPEDMPKVIVKYVETILKNTNESKKLKELGKKIKLD